MTYTDEEIAEAIREQEERSARLLQETQDALRIYSLAAKYDFARQFVLSKFGHEDESLVEQIVAYLEEYTT